MIENDINLRQELLDFSLKHVNRISDDMDKFLSGKEITPEVCKVAKKMLDDMGKAYHIRFII